MGLLGDVGRFFRSFGGADVEGRGSGEKLTPKLCDYQPIIFDPITSQRNCAQDGILVTPAEFGGRLSNDNPRGAYRYKGAWYITPSEYMRRQAEPLAAPGQRMRRTTERATVVTDQPEMAALMPSRRGARPEVTGGTEMFIIPAVGLPAAPPMRAMTLDPAAVLRGMDLGQLPARLRPPGVAPAAEPVAMVARDKRRYWMAVLAIILILGVLTMLMRGKR